MIEPGQQTFNISHSCVQPDIMWKRLKKKTHSYSKVISVFQQRECRKAATTKPAELFSRPARGKSMD